ncbi:unnamed protein product [Brassica napus]|uniref:(rape) hypothetical protein n=1 Tax=Brassica napus TaxID=3708 RepID=A0A816W611_BRANA|nr:unnamed protein product [Brassica napus]
MEGSSKKMMKRPIEEVYGCDAAEGLFFVCPTNTGYPRMIESGIQQSKFNCCPNRVA